LRAFDGKLYAIHLWDLPGRQVNKGGAMVHRVLNDIGLGELSTIGDAEIEKVDRMESVAYEGRSHERETEV
jgi:hypothetical protein